MFKVDKKQWPGYNELAWVEPILAPPEDYVQETELLCQAIKDHSKIESNTLLHLGSGAGINDYTFKKHFIVTGVDISAGMLDVARSLNPEVVYHHGDMRTVQLDERFDAVAIPDSIGYMTTQDDIRKTLQTAYRHLKPGGLLLIVTHLKEEFTENNFVYTGSEGDLEITVFENNYIPNTKGDIYEATIIYLIRLAGRLEIHNECHVIGLFTQAVWHGLLKESGFTVQQQKIEDRYKRYVMGEGEYPMQMFICIRGGSD